MTAPTCQHDTDYIVGKCPKCALSACPAPDKKGEEKILDAVSVTQQIILKWHGRGLAMVCHVHGNEFIQADDDGNLFCDHDDHTDAHPSAYLVHDDVALTDEFVKAFRSFGRASELRGAERVERAVNEARVATCPHTGGPAIWCDDKSCQEASCLLTAASSAVLAIKNGK